MEHRLAKLVGALVVAASLAAQERPADYEREAATRPLTVCNLAAASEPVATLASGSHDAFGVVVNTRGRLLAIYRRGQTHAQDPGSIVQAESTDGGGTWTLPRVLFSDPLVDQRNVAGGLLPSGTIVIFWNRYDLAPRYYSAGVMFARSTDGGVTWSLAEPLSGTTAYGPIVDTPAGPAMVIVDGATQLAFSHDDGRTWSDRRPIGDLPTNETAIIWSGGNELLGFTRNLQQQPMLMHRSLDLGHTWRTVAADIALTPMPGTLVNWLLVSPWLFRPDPASSQVTLLFGERQTVQPLHNYGVLRIVTFDPHAVAKSFAALDRLFQGDYIDFGYPSATQLPSGRYVVQFHSELYPAGPANLFYTGLDFMRTCDARPAR